MYEAKNAHDSPNGKEGSRDAANKYDLWTICA